VRLCRIKEKCLKTDLECVNGWSGSTIQWKTVPKSRSSNWETTSSSVQIVRRNWQKLLCGCFTYLQCFVSTLVLCYFGLQIYNLSFTSNCKPNPKDYIYNHNPRHNFYLLTFFDFLMSETPLYRGAIGHPIIHAIKKLKTSFFLTALREKKTLFNSNDRNYWMADSPSSTVAFLALCQEST